MLRDRFNDVWEKAYQEDTAWAVVGLSAAVLTGIAMRALIKKGWKSALGSRPPVNPVAPDTGWQEAVAFTAVVGAGVGVARLLGRRSAAAAWRKFKGDYPRKLRRPAALAGSH